MNQIINELIKEYKRLGYSLLDIKDELLEYIENNCDHKRIYIRIKKDFFTNITITCKCCKKFEGFKIQNINEINIKTEVFKNAIEDVNEKLIIAINRYKNKEIKKDNLGIDDLFTDEFYF